MKIINSAIKLSLVTTLLASAIVTSTQTVAATVATDCNPVAVKTCGLPFPSDLFMDQETQRLHFDDAILDREITGPIRQTNTLLSQMDPSFSPAQIYNGSTGFSAAGPVLFELPSTPATKIPKDGGNIALVFDLDTGERVDMVAELSAAARKPIDPAKASSVVAIWPRSRLEFGHRYVAVLTTALKAKSGTASVDYVRSAGMDIALGLAAAQTEADDRLVEAYSESLDVLQLNGIDATNVLSATFFTVRTEQEVTGPLLHMADYIQAQPLKISALKPGKSLGTTQYALGTLYGRVDLVNFRDANGGVNAPYDPVPSATQNNVQVLMTIPRVDPGTVMPVALWAHGVGNQKEVTRTGFDRNDSGGIVSVAIDHPNHGSRYNNKIPLQQAFSKLSGPKFMTASLGVYIQASLDQVALMTAIKNNMNEALDEARPALPGLESVDTDRLVYHSLSFGSMVGVAAVAVANDIRGGFFLSGCGNLMHIFATSLFWDTNKNSFPKDASGAEVMFQMAMMQHYIDIADGINFAQYYRNPPPGRAEKKVVMQYAIDDGNVLNEISESQAILMDLPLMSQVYRATPWLRYGTSGGIDGYEDGYGIYQLPYLIPDAEAKLAEAATVEQQVAALMQQLGQPMNFSIVDLVYDILYNSYLRFKVHLTTGIPESMRKNRAWNCEVLESSPELCVRGIEPQVAN
jgi:hypothetical protein